MENIVMIHGIEVKKENGNLVIVCDGDNKKLLHILRLLDESVSPEVVEHLLKV